ncbi:MAG: hypothetical protein HW406_2286 [Candidatus Brocadiaceae bacterium]|nr:hypothetical protein [Candidatus Brocadiaceae bacterium]
MARPTFPKTLREFRERFATESACLNYLWESRWPEGFRCPRCGSRRAWPLGERRVWECQGCGLQISPTAGTLLHRSHFPLREWFWGGLPRRHPHARFQCYATPTADGMQLQDCVVFATETPARHGQRRSQPISGADRGG